MTPMIGVIYGRFHQVPKGHCHFLAIPHPSHDGHGLCHEPDAPQ